MAMSQNVTGTAFVITFAHKNQRDLGLVGLSLGDCDVRV